MVHIIKILKAQETMPIVQACRQAYGILTDSKRKYTYLYTFNNDGETVAFLLQEENIFFTIKSMK